MIAGVVASQITIVVLSAISPSTESISISSAEYILSSNLYVNGDGTTYFSLTADGGDGVTIEVAKNGSLVGTVYSSGGGYTSNRTISVISTDVLSYYIWVDVDNYHSVTIELRKDNSSGAILFTGNYELDNY